MKYKITLSEAQRLKALTISFYFIVKTVLILCGLASDYPKNSQCA